MSNHLIPQNKLITYSKISFWINVGANILFLILTAISHYFSIINGYDWTYWELSELVIFSFESKILFSTACVVDGFCLFLLLIPLKYYFPMKKIRIVFSIFSFTIASSLIGIGAFPVDLFQIVHNIFGVSFFVSSTFFISFLAIIIQKYLKSLPKWLYYQGYFTSCFIIFHLISRFYFGQAFTQRLAVFFLMTFLLVFSWKIINLRKINENVGGSDLVAPVLKV